MKVQSGAAPQTSTSKISVKNIMAGSVGHVMEWFDYAVYSFASPIIAAQFFPSDDPVTSLLATFAVFAVGFAARPLGAFVLGPLGDKIGSTKVLSLAIILMAMSTLFMGLLPTYAQIGIWAPILLIAARLVQGFSVGGEIGSASTFLVEIAPRKRRGFYGSWTHQSTSVGMLLASLVYTILSLSLSSEALNSWGWRVPFIFSIFLAVFGFYLRKKMPNTPKFEEVLQHNEVVKQPFKKMLFTYRREMFRVVGVVVSFTIGFYFIFTYLPTYVKTVVHASYASAFGSNVLGLAFFAIILPFLGLLSDRVGRKPLMLTAYAGFAILTYPVLLMINSGSFVLLVVAQLVLVLLLALVAAPLQTALAEMFPTRVRNSSLSIAYNVSIALFGGTAPLVATYLNSISGNSPLSLAIYIGVGGVVSFFTLLPMKDKWREELS